MSRKTISLFFLIVAAVPSFSQTPAAAYGVADDSGSRMTVPAAVSMEQPSLSFSSETGRSSYIRGGLTFGTAYDDNIQPGTGTPISDISYTVQPTISLVESMSRLNLTLLYAPGFTFYQRTSSRNQDNQNVALDFKYRLSPHVTLNIKENFLRTSNYLNQFDQMSAGALQTPNLSVIAPLADQMNTTTVGQLSYQFAPNAMVGGTGTFSQLTYPNRPQAPGLYDSSAKSVEGFYTHRLSGKHYIGATYQFQSLLTSPGQAETKTNSVVLFYTLYLNSHFTVSVFAGPEHSATRGLGLISSNAWSPEAGGSVSWQGERMSFAAEVAKKISQGGGLQGAVRSESASVSIRRQLTKGLGASLAANYSNNSVLDGIPIAGNNTSGHLISGSSSLRRQLGEHLALEMDYTRLRQVYANIPGVSNHPDRNRYAASISYEFRRPLGR